MILQVIVNLAFHPSQHLAHICVIIGIFSPGTLNQDSRQDSRRDDGNCTDESYVDFCWHECPAIAALWLVLILP
jgi:hypothetical protein